MSIAAVQDSTGGSFWVDSCSHSFSKDGSGNILTDVATGYDTLNKPGTWTKTFTYDGNGIIATESQWVRS